MRLTIQVANQEEGRLIKAGLGDPEVYALVKMVGTLAPLTDAQRRGAMSFLQYRINRMADLPVVESPSIQNNGDARQQGLFDDQTGKP